MPLARRSTGCFQDGSLNLVCSHVFGTPLVVKQDEIPDVVDIGFFSFEAVTEANRFSELIEQTRWLRLRHWLVLDNSGIWDVIGQK